MNGPTGGKEEPLGVVPALVEVVTVERVVETLKVVVGATEEVVVAAAEVVVVAAAEVVVLDGGAGVDVEVAAAVVVVEPGPADFLR